MLFVRLVASPVLPPVAVDALHRRFADRGMLLACATDADVNATVLSLATPHGDLRTTTKDAAETIGASNAVGRAFRIEIQHQDPEAVVGDDALRAVAVDVHGALRAPVYSARRTMPAGRFSVVRPMGWGPEGLALGDSAPMLPFGGSESSGVAIEVGGHTVIVKARIAGGLSVAQLESVAQAVGAADSGLAEVGAYPIGISRDGAATVVLELSDVKRVPLHRALAVIEIEARRYGARLALGTLLSDAPLDMLLDALAAHMGLRVGRAQVIETHLAQRPVAG